MISLKRHIDAEYTSSTLLRAMSDAYRETLSAVAASAAQALPSADNELEKQLSLFGEQMVAADSPEAIAATGTAVSGRLAVWGAQAEQDLKRKVAEVKELLVTLAQTASSVAASDAANAQRFDGLRSRLEKIATLNDVTEIRGAVLASAGELRVSVEVMSNSTRTSLKTMRSQLDAYQSKLEAAENLAAHDVLTGLMNRRRIETMIERRIERGAPFSLGLVDLDGFKAINDRHGHGAGDDLLRQFSADLKANARTTDAVGRWGGDEFIVLFDGPAAGARTHFARVQQWVGGSYTLDGPRGKVKVQIALSIGVAEWRQGMTAARLVEDADQKMYAVKRSK